MKSTPDVCDAYEGGIAVVEPLFTNFGCRERFYGEAVSVKCFEENSKVKKEAGTAGHNRVMVVDGGGSLRRALFGAMDLGARALATHPIKTEKRGLVMLMFR